MVESPALQVALKSLDQTYVGPPTHKNWRGHLDVSMSWSLEQKVDVSFSWCSMCSVASPPPSSCLPIYYDIIDICHICVWPSLTTFVLFLHHQGAKKNTHNWGLFQDRTFLTKASCVLLDTGACLLAFNYPFFCLIVGWSDSFLIQETSGYVW